MSEAWIVAAGRSPIGRAGKGSLVGTRPDDLAAYVIKKVLDRVPQLPLGDIEDVICGCAMPNAEHGWNVARAISILAGLNVPGTTVNRFCSSSLQTTRIAAHAIKAGEGDVFLSAGVECISRYYQGRPEPPDSRNPRLMPGNAERLADYYISMGETAENVAEREHISREEMDRFACLSQTRAEAAQASGHFDGEIVPVPLPDGQTFARDECPRPGTTVEVLGTLKPAFRENGQVTAGNSCPFSDGAAAVVVMSDKRAKDLGIKPLARIVSTAVSALEPEYMGLGPIEASTHALRLAGMTIDDVELVELNEAFAAQVIPSARGFGIDPFGDKLNPFGGAIAFGHPYGMTGARITATLLNGLAARNQTVGLETMCVGGGQGMAMIVERI